MLSSFSSLQAQGQTLPSNFTVEGRLYDSNGLPVSSSTSFVMLELLSDQNPNCVLYREHFPAIDLGSSELTSIGVFSLRLGTGTTDFASNGLPLPAFFKAGVYGGDTNDDNSGSTGECTGTIDATRQTLLRIRFKTAVGSSWETLNPDTRITAVPTAMIADSANTLEGKAASAFLLTNTSTALLQANVENVFSATNYSTLTTLLAGGYISSAPGAPVGFNNQRLTSLADPTGAQDAATKKYADTKLAGQDVSTSGTALGSGGGMVLTWDQVQNKWVAQALPGSVTNIVLGNGMVAGTITAAGTIAVDTGTTGNKIVQLSGGKLPAVDASMLTNIQYPVSSVNGKLGNINLLPSDIPGLGTAATRNAGTLAGNVMEFLTNSQLPALDGSLLTEVSATYLRTRLVSATVPTSGQILTWNGSQWEPAAAPISGITQLYGDVSATGPGNVNAAIGNDKITAAKIASSGGGVGRLLITDGASGATVTYAACLNGEVMKYNTVTGWGCAADAGASGMVTLVAAGAGLVPGTISSVGTLNVDVGTAANKIIQLTAGAQIPGVDGALVTNINAERIQGRTVAASSPLANQVLRWTGTQWEPSDATVGTLTSVASGNGLLGGTFTVSGTLSVDTGTAANKIVQLNANAQTALTAGTAALPTYSFANNTNAGMYDVGVGTLGFATAGSARMVIDPGGNVGIGTPTPRSRLDIGAGSLSGAPATNVAAATIDFSQSNLAYTANNCGAFALNNMKDGATYTLAVKGTVSAICSFQAYADAGSTMLNVRVPTTHGATTAGAMTMYTFQVMGTDVFITWSSHIVNPPSTLR